MPGMSGKTYKSKSLKPNRDDFINNDAGAGIKPKKLKFSFNEQREFATIDEDIAELEERLEELDSEIEKNSTSYGKLTELTKEKEEVQKQLDEKMERWIYLNDLNEKIQAQ